MSTTHVITSNQTPRPRVDGLFVYGTLMPSKTKKFQNFTGLQPTTHPAMLNGYMMYDLGHFPGIIQGDLSMAVQGEFISFSEFNDADLLSIFQVLDSYEGFPHLYVIHKVKVHLDKPVVGTPTDVRQAYTYVYNGLLHAGAKEASHETLAKVTVYSW